MLCITPAGSAFTRSEVKNTGMAAAAGDNIRRLSVGQSPQPEKPDRPQSANMETTFGRRPSRTGNADSAGAAKDEDEVDAEDPKEPTAATKQAPGRKGQQPKAATKRTGQRPVLRKIFS